MPDSASRIVVEAHTLRSQTAKAALLHGSQRTPRELRRPYAGIIGSLVVGVVLVVVVWAATKIGNLIEEQRERRRATTATAEQLAGGPYTAQNVNRGPLLSRERAGPVVGVEDP